MTGAQCKESLRDRRRFDSNGALDRRLCLLTFFAIGGDGTLPVYTRGLMRKDANPQINVAAIGASLIAFRASR